MSYYKASLFTLVLFSFSYVLETEAAAIVCPVSSIQCNTTKLCIDLKYLCDGDKDCEDGEDEINCQFKDSGCGDISHRRNDTGVITSMNYPRNYTSLAKCQWYIDSPNELPIDLKFAEIFNLEKPRHNECVYDFVSVYQLEPLLFVGRYCGVTSPGLVHLNSRKVLIEFQSDGQTNGQGFKVTWSTRVQESPSSNIVVRADFTTSTVSVVTPLSNAQCVGQYEYGGDLGHFSSPNFGQPYDTPLFCRWLIVVAPGYRISLVFISLDVGDATVDGCEGGWLEIYDGPDNGAPSMGTYCGVAMPTGLLTSSNLLYLLMTAQNNSGEHIGFQATYKSIYIEPPSTTTIGPLPPGCDGTALVLTSTSGQITSPFYNRLDTYVDSIDCQWILVAPPGQVFYIRFNDFDLEQSGGCDSDYLRVYDDDGDLLTLPTNFENQTLAHSMSLTNITDAHNLTQLANLCGLMRPYDVESNSSRAVIIFHSDSQYGGYGFNLSFSVTTPSVKCSGDLFQCTSGDCVLISNVCNGPIDCPDGSDEYVCPSSSCGKPSVQIQVTRIVGGSEAADGAWPWTVSVVDKERPGHICGATLIHPKWALSAAHCFDTVFTRNYDKFAIVAGRHHLLLTDAHEQWRFVEDVYMHRNYSSGTSKNDIALIKLKQPFNLNDHVNLLCLPESKVKAGSPCYITGWGETLGTCCANNLKQALVPIMNTTICAGADYYGDRLKEHMLCAGYPEGGVDTCDGDSGGPLSCETSLGDRHWELQGITSWGLLCAGEKSPGVYTAVFDFVMWIRQTIANNF